LEISYDPTVSDLVESGLEAFRTNKVIRRNTTVSSCLCAFIVGALLYYSSNNFELSAGCVLCGAVAAALCYAVLPKTMAMMLRRRSKKFLASPSGKGALEPRTFSLNSRGVRIWSKSFDKLYPYETIAEIRLKKDYIILPLKDGTSLIFPDRAFPDLSVREEFLAELRSRCTPAVH